MSLSLNPADVWKIFADRKEKDKEKIAKWLEDVASDARTLADFWMAAASSKRKEVDTVPGAQSILYERVKGSYEFATDVFGGRLEPKLQDMFMMTTGSMINRRDSLKLLYESLYGKTSGLKFADSRSRTEQLNDLKSAVALLNREAVALELLARRFRASK